MKNEKKKYRVLIKQVIAGIKTGEYRAGKRLPGQLALAERYEVSAITANRALNELQKLGYIERRERSGSFVLEQPRFLSTIFLVGSGKHVNEDLWLTLYWQGICDCTESMNISTQIVKQDDPAFREAITENMGNTGVILVGFENPALVKVLEARKIQHLVVGTRAVYAKYNVVENRRLMASELTETMLKDGVERLGFFGTLDYQNHAEAAEGYRIALSSCSKTPFIVDVNMDTVVHKVRKTVRAKSLDAIIVMGGGMPFLTLSYLISLDKEQRPRLGVMTENKLVENLKGTAYLASYSQHKVGELAFALIYELASGKIHTPTTRFCPHKIIRP